MIYQIIFAFCATISFSILFNSPKSELLLCGLTGAMGWLFYNMTISLSGGAVLATFIGAVFITLVSRILSVLRKMPITVFLICGIFSLVPGAGIYNTMYSILLEDLSSAAVRGVETLKLAGVIAIGIVVILSLPNRLFQRNQKSASD